MAKNKKGKIIVIEGIDGSGKSAQSKILIDFFKKRKIKYKFFKYPRHAKPFFGIMVDQYLNGEFGDIENIDSKLTSLIYAMDRWESKEKIIKWKEEGYIVILDRYTTSNMGHQLSCRPKKKWKEMLEWIINLEYKILGIPRPDKVLFLDVDVDFSFRNLRNRRAKKYIKGKSKSDILENIAHQKKAKEAYMYAIRNDKNWEIVDCMHKNQLLSPDEIHKKILNILGFSV